MPKYQASQVFEFDYRVVWESRCLAALFPLDPDADIGRLYHAHIVEAIAYRQSQLFTPWLLLD